MSPSTTTLSNRHLPSVPHVRAISVCTFSLRHTLNQTEQETWEQSRIEGVPRGHDVVTNPTCPQPGFTLPRRQFVTLNRLRCGQARYTESLYRWGVIASPACPCGESHQTTRHTVDECPLTAFPGGLRRLHEAGPDAVE